MVMAKGRGVLEYGRKAHSKIKDYGILKLKIRPLETTPVSVLITIDLFDPC
jgi:hypothetical protein